MSENTFNLPSEKCQSETKDVLQQIANKLGETTGALDYAINTANAAGTIASTKANEAENKIIDVENRFQTLTTKQQQDAEVVDARQGELSLGANLTLMKTSLSDIAINIKSFGAKGDNITDDSQSFKDAITYCLANNRSLYVPEGKYIINSAFSTSAISNLSIFGEGSKSIICWYDKVNPLWIGENTHIYNIDFLGQELISDVLIVAGYYNGVFASAFNSSIEKVNIDTTFWGGWTGIRLLGRGGGFYHFKIKNVYVRGVGIGVEVSTYAKVGETVGWLTDIILDDVFIRSFAYKGLYVKNDYNKTDGSKPGQLTQCLFNNIVIQAQNRGASSSGVVVGGGANIYNITSIFNDTMSDTFTAIEFYNDLIISATTDVNYLKLADFCIGNNQVNFGMVEGFIKFNKMENLNTYQGYSLKYGYLKSQKNNMISDGDFKKDIIGYPILNNIAYTYDINNKCIKLDGNNTLGKDIAFLLSNDDMTKLNNSEFLTFWILCDTDNGSTLNASTFRKELYTNISGYTTNVVIGKTIGDKILFVLYFKRDSTKLINLSDDTKYLFLKLFFDVANLDDYVNIYEVGLAPCLQLYSENIPCANISRKTIKVTVSASTTTEYLLRTLFGYFHPIYTTLKIDCVSNITVVRTIGKVTITNSNVTPVDVYITY